ncbi:MarR family winged helix-turn-helix transcriptional regulator [Roseococcus sp. YIM B11640]|uniref:MarR family winged helix-turn-helix transcriptional regulator n=1 Tax=Roseococcus sp. YIM B11640 TaxID=3133973 RepID=UPI003C7A5796
MYMHSMHREALRTQDVESACTAISADCLAFAARRAANLISRVYALHLSPSGLEPSQFLILNVVASHSTGSARELADRLGIERSTLTRNLARLLEGGLLVSAPGEGRRITYRLTPAGREKLAEALPLWAAAQAAVTARLRPGVAEAARDSLDELHGAAAELIDKAPA